MMTAGKLVPAAASLFLMAIAGTAPFRAARGAGRELTVAAISVSTLDGAIESNYDRAYRLCEVALASKPDIILLPEAFAAGYPGANLSPYAEPKESSQLRRFRDLSGRAGCMIVLGYLERVPNGIQNAVVIFDSGEAVGRHYKSSLWKDKKRPYRDEATLMIPGSGIEIFETRFGRLAVITCFENYVPANWALVSPKVDFILSPYNCEHDPGDENIALSKLHGVPSAWADRTGTVFAGGNKFAANLGSAGLVDAEGRVIARSRPGIEEIVLGKLKTR
jgi:predicted amidohydrolase